MPRLSFYASISLLVPFITNRCDCRANAEIEIAPMPDNHKYKIGWIQACTHMVFHNTYGDEG